MSNRTGRRGRPGDGCTLGDHLQQGVPVPLGEVLDHVSNNLGLAAHCGQPVSKLFRDLRPDSTAVAIAAELLGVLEPLSARDHYTAYDQAVHRQRDARTDVVTLGVGIHAGDQEGQGRIDVALVIQT
jgi:hypothetical protein